MRGYNEIERRRLLLFGALCTEWAKAKMPLRRGAPRSSQAGATIASLARIIPFANVALTLGWCKVLPFVRIVYARLLTFRTPYCLTSPKKKKRKGKEKPTASGESTMEKILLWPFCHAAMSLWLWLLMLRLWFNCAALKRGGRMLLECRVSSTVHGYHGIHLMKI